MNNTIIYLIRHSEQIKQNEDYISVENEQLRNENVGLSEFGEKKAK